MEDEFDIVTWTRLNGVINKIRNTEQQLEILKSQFNDDLPTSCNYAASILASEMEVRQTCINKLRKRIDCVQKLYISKRRTMHEVHDKLAKKQVDFDKLVEKNETLVEKLVENNEQMEKLRKTNLIQVRLISFRKLYLIQEIVDLFKIDIDGGPASNQPRNTQSDCKCVLIDTIRSLHLPQIASVQVAGHSEIETTSAVGYVVQVLDAISMVLDYPLRYPVICGSSTSKILFPIENMRAAQLYNWKKRLDRDKFQEGLVWFGKNIAQLRGDCGIPTPHADKTLSVLADWVRSINGGFRRYVCIYERPTASVTSPASLLINYE
ncbi:unnamed protein product [Caenorhabditis angaria]|uniref:Uncharacterized protein n=1 Tax=Caenorhabditis angaria TaxID=860376 RepID=A0A9P1NAS2_9PELO|nr:unnamed protein product [Caenorhabditis angaria]